MAGLLDADRRLIVELSRNGLCDVLNVMTPGLLDLLIQRQVVTGAEAENIEAGSTRPQQVDILLDCLKQKSNQQFDDLCAVLHQLQLGHIYQEFLSGDVIPRHVEVLQEKLCRYYMEEYSQVDMFTWHEEGHCIRLDEIYVPVRTATYHKTPESKEKKSLQHYSELFQPDEGKTLKLITVKAEPLGGKTTFIQKLSSDWAKTVRGQFECDLLGQYKIVLPIILRLVKPSSSLSQNLQYQMDFLTSEDMKVIEWTLQEEPERVLFLYDGLDELTVDNSQELVSIMRGYTHPECTVLITTRAEAMHKLHAPGQRKHRPYIEAHLEGFSDADIRKYIKKYFSGRTSTDHEELAKKIFEVNELHDMATNPGRLGILCLVWHHDKAAVGYDRVQLFTEFVHILLKLYEERQQGVNSCPYTRKKDLLSYHKNSLCKFGKLANKHDAKGTVCTVFSMQDVNAVVGEKAMEYGFLYRSLYVSCREEPQVSFIHKSVQEWLAAFCLANDEEELGKLQYESAACFMKDSSMREFLLFFVSDNIDKYQHNQLKNLCDKLLPHLAPVFLTRNNFYYYIYKHKYLGTWLKSTLKYFNVILPKMFEKDIELKHFRDFTLLHNVCFGQILGMLEHLPTVQLAVWTTEELTAFFCELGETESRFKYLVIGGIIGGEGTALGKLLHSTQQCVAWCKPTAADVASMIKVTGGHQLSSVQHLSMLSMPGNNLHGAGADLGELLLNMPQCTQLHVSQCGLEAADVAAMVKVIRGHQLGVQHLDMRHNNLQGVGASLGKLLFNMPQCTQLDVSNCGLEAVDVAAMVEVTRGHQLSIQHLIFGNLHCDVEDYCSLCNNLQGAGAALGELLLNMEHCTQLDVSECGLKAADVAAMAEVTRGHQLGIQLLNIGNIKLLIIENTCLYDSYDDISYSLRNQLKGAGAGLGRLLLNMPQCTQLNVSDSGLCAQDVAAMVEVARGHQLSIQHLDIGNHHYTCYMNTDYSLHFSYIPVSLCYLQGAGAALGKLLLNMSQCTQLDVSECWLEAADVAAMVEVTRGHQLGIQHLDMGYNNLQGAGAALAEMMPVAGGSMPHLQVLRLHRCSLTSSDLQTLTAGIKADVHIKRLDLSNNTFQGAGAAVGQLLLRLASCHTLDLQYCRLTASDMRAAAVAICDASSGDVHIRKLDLSGNDFGGDGAAVGQLLLRLASCHTLHLEFCSLTASDIRAAAATIHDAGSGDVHIKQLGLSYNDLRGAGASVGQLLLGLASCHTLDLQCCNLTASDIRAAAVTIRGAHIQMDQLRLWYNDISNKEKDDLMRLPELSFVRFDHL